MADETLSAFVESVCGDSHLRVEDDLGNGFVRLRSAEAERRQAAHDIRSTEDIVIEMLRNARDAHARSIFLAATREGNQRRIVMIDDGDGIPASMHERIFEPRVTSKLDTMHVDKWGVHGRGMALYSIAVNTEVARVATSAAELGSAFVIETNLNHLGEKTDQSTFPTFEQTAAGTVSVRGPRNILRTACEFALEHRRSCTVHLGSATDIAATLYAYGLTTLARTTQAFCPDPALVPVCKRLAVAGDPAAFVELAASLGLIVSERSARRIMDGTLAPVAPLLDRISIAGIPATAAPTGKKRPAQPTGDARGLKIAADDLSTFSQDIADAYRDLARRYYLEPAAEPAVRVGKDAIHITIPVTKLL